MDRGSFDGRASARLCTTLCCSCIVLIIKQGSHVPRDLSGEIPRLVGVPTHFFKVVLAEPKGTDLQPVVGTFVMPNAAIDPRTPLMLFSVPISALEEAAGRLGLPNHSCQPLLNKLHMATDFLVLAGFQSEWG